MTSKKRNEKKERKELRETLSKAYEKPAPDPDFTRRIMQKGRYTRPAPYLQRLCNKATAFFCSPTWLFIGLAAGIGLLQDKIIILTDNLCNGQSFNSAQGMQGIFVLGGLFGLILFACKEMIREADN